MPSLSAHGDVVIVRDNVRANVLLTSQVVGQSFVHAFDGQLVAQVTEHSTAFPTMLQDQDNGERQTDRAGAAQAAKRVRKQA